MILKGYEVIPCIYVGKRFKYNYGLIQRLLTKFKFKNIEDYQEDIAYVVSDKKQIYVSYEIYAKLEKEANEQAIYTSN